MDKPPFDPQRGAFWLIAMVVSVHAIIVLAASVSCIYNAELILTTEAVCDPQNRLSGLLSGALAAALAFAGLKKDK